METARNCGRESCQALQYIESHLQPEPSPQSVSLHTHMRGSDDIDMAFECD